MDASGRDDSGTSGEPTGPTNPRPADPGPAGPADPGPADYSFAEAPDVGDVASIVGELSESAERPASGRPLNEVARSALARVMRRGRSAGRRDGDGDHGPGVTDGADAAPWPSAATGSGVMPGPGMPGGPDTVAEPGTASGARAAAGPDMAPGSGVTPGSGVAHRGLDAMRHSPDLVRRGSDLARRSPDLVRRGSDLARRSPDLVRSGPDLVRRGSAGTRRGTGVVGRGTRLAGRGVQRGSRWLAGEVLALAPRLPVRDQATLRGQFPGKSPDELADALIEGASRASAAVGATVGIWSVLPVAPAFPAEIVTETLTLVGIEIKLIAELHEVYDMRPPGDFASRMTAFVGAWAHRGGVTLTPGGVVLAMGSPLGRRLQRRLAARAGRSAISLGPLLTGAAAGALLNRRETRRLGQEIHDELRKRSPTAATWPR
ncbi:MAG: hypothetical protein ACLPKE_06260 [Streptosporangiaceae bacterium]